MKTESRSVEELANREYRYGFVTDIEADAVPPGLSEDTVRAISARGTPLDSSSRTLRPSSSRAVGPSDMRSSMPWMPRTWPSMPGA